ncbi:MAG: dephospho-CoA kinase [Bacteroidales bacterium]|nr:dephospho-CoA kinase [Bacteroidales bacterium]
MFRVGLTGGIGSGKSLICSILEKLGVPVYYADAEAKRLMNSDPDLMTQIVELFGEQAYRQGSLDRKYLAERLFGDAEMLSAMNRVVHPAVHEDFKRWTNLQKEVPYVVEEAAILFESGAHGDLDYSVLAYAPVEIRISRVMDRDGTDRESVLKRMGHQLSEEEKKKLADHVIVNDGQQMLLPQVIELHNKLLKRK